MTSLLEEAVEEMRALPEDEQDQAARALLAFARERKSEAPRREGSGTRRA
jgi:hypothetical protein